MTSKLTLELDAMAAELALGVLEGEERAEALRLALANPDFAAAVQAWRDRLDPLGDDFGEVPPPKLWPLIEAQLADVAKLASPLGVRFWRNTAVAAGAIAASLAAVLVLSPSALRSPGPGVQPSSVAVAQIIGGEGIRFAARIDPQNKRLVIRAESLPPSSLAHELWVIPSDGVPRSLGLIAPDGITQVALSVHLEPLLVDGASLAVSLEDASGAPHAAPSSTPIATGRISSI